MHLSDMQNRSYPLKDGGEISIDVDGQGVYHVDRWDAEMNNVWNKTFKEFYDALDEYQKWKEQGNE